MKNILPILVTCAALAVTSPAFAGGIQLDGQLPMYPPAKLDPKEASLTPAAIAQGVPLVLLTNDSVHTVDAWYVSHVPKACSRHEMSGGIKYACPGGSIMVYAHGGQTQIAFVPPMFKF
jgi:hypothetical protein